MRKADREIKSFEEIVDVLRRCDTVRLGLGGGEYPYVVPLSFGLEVQDGKIVLYVHGAMDGEKHARIAKDNRTCVEADLCHRFVDMGHNVTTDYESVIGFGRVEPVTEEAEAMKGLALMLDHCGFAGYPFSPEALKVTRVYRIVLESVTGKRNRP